LVGPEMSIRHRIPGGVTPLEALAGACYVVRGVTTRTKTGGSPDATWRELTTILVVDEVIPGIRRALRAKFRRAKNTAQSRGAIRSQTVMELEKRVGREIIDSYEDVTVSALEDDPTVCLVEFAFTVAHGLNQVWLAAHITV
ncbi:MAG: phage tail sheath protein, partial [Oscillospiraceae bacterium]|nr:phage tail sheath protein [Oscillospiraceae bacterium]